MCLARPPTHKVPQDHSITNIGQWGGGLSHPPRALGVEHEACSLLHPDWSVCLIWYPLLILTHTRIQSVVSLHSSKILTIPQGITRGVSSIGKPCRPEHRFPRPNCPGNTLIFQKYVLCVTVWFRLYCCWINNPLLTLQLLSGRLNNTFVLDLSHVSRYWS